MNFVIHSHCETLGWSKQRHGWEEEKCI